MRTPQQLFFTAYAAHTTAIASTAPTAEAHPTLVHGRTYPFLVELERITAVTPAAAPPQPPRRDRSPYLLAAVGILGGIIAAGLGLMVARIPEIRTAVAALWSLSP